MRTISWEYGHKGAKPMNLEEHNRLMGEEMARHQRVKAELDYRLKIAQQMCSHPSDTIDGKCTVCGLKLPTAHEMHKMQQEG